MRGGSDVPFSQRLDRASNDIWYRFNLSHTRVECWPCHFPGTSSVERPHDKGRTRRARDCLDVAGIAWHLLGRHSRPCVYNVHVVCLGS